MQVIAAKRIYIIGGSTGRVSQNTLSYINLQKMQAVSLPNMNSTRVYPAAARVEDRIYVFGGSITTSESWESKTLDSCEVFSITQNNWSPIPPMSTPRSMAGAMAYKHLVSQILS
jgi:N-acetylneuraminic acid mutarotase